MTRATSINLADLPAPTIVEPLDFEAIRSAMIADFRARYPEFDAVLESDPAIKLIEAAAFRELNLRARVNDAARGVMLAYAAGSDLDHLAALLNVKRIDGETDARLRERTQLSHESYTAAGSPGAYIWHALSASLAVKDAAVSSPRPGRVEIVLLGTASDGSLPDAEMTAVREAINAEHVKPLTDIVTVRQASMIDVDISADLYLYRGPDAAAVTADATAALDRYLDSLALIGRDLALSGVHGALHVAGVQRVELRAPAADIRVDARSALRRGKITVNVAGRND